MKRNWKRKILGGLSFTSALFIFQACYGTPQDFGVDLLVEGQVKSKSTGLPLKGIKVSADNTVAYQLTDDDGRFSFYTEYRDRFTVQCSDIDSSQNGSYRPMDTVVSSQSESLFLTLMLDDK